MSRGLSLVNFQQLLIEIDKDRALGHVSVSNHRWFTLADAEQSRLE